MMVPVTVVPPTGILLGKLIVWTRGARTFNVPTTESEPVVAVITTLVSVPVTSVVAVKKAVVAFAGTVIVDGTLTSGFVLTNVTTVPPAGAADCTVPSPGVAHPLLTRDW